MFFYFYRNNLINTYIYGSKSEYLGLLKYFFKIGLSVKSMHKKRVVLKGIVGFFRERKKFADYIASQINT